MLVMCNCSIKTLFCMIHILFSVLILTEPPLICYFVYWSWNRLPGWAFFVWLFFVLFFFFFAMDYTHKGTLHPPHHPPTEGRREKLWQKRGGHKRKRESCGRNHFVFVVCCRMCQHIISLGETPLCVSTPFLQMRPLFSSATLRSIVFTEVTVLLCPWWCRWRCTQSRDKVELWPLWILQAFNISHFIFVKLL